MSSPKKKFLSSVHYGLGVLVLVMPFVASIPRVAYATGAIEISSCEELQAMNDDLAASYVLTDDIDCSIDVGTATYTEDFETSTADDWTSSGTNDAWDLYTETCTTETVTDPIEFGSTVLGTYGNAGADCLRESDEDSYALSPVVSIPETDVVSLQLDSYGLDEGGTCNDDYDQKVVAVTTDGGTTHTVLNDCYRLHPFMEDGLDQRVWRFDLSDFAGEDVQFMFLYHTDDDCCDEELGWFVDNLEVLEGGDAALMTVGNDDDLFTGTFNGQGHTITNLNLAMSQLGVGLFGEIAETALVKNVTIADSTISNVEEGTGAVVGINLGTVRDVYTSNVTILGGEDSTGSLVGENEGTLFNARASGGSVTGVDDVGGVAGYNGEAATMTFTQSSADVMGQESLGGVLGDNDAGGIVSNAQATGDVGPRYINADTVGGLVGYNLGSVSQALAAGDVSGQEDVGGFVGFNEEDAQVTEAYSRGEVTAPVSVGGFAGYSAGGITNVFTVSPVPLGEDSAETGGLIGEYNGGTLTGAYYDMERTLTYCTLDGSDPDPDGCIGVNGEDSTPNYFKSNHENPPLDEWDFDEAWIVVTDDYPALIFAADTDNDGVLSEIEENAPNDGDGNNDGTPDSEQANVTSLEDSVSGDYAVLEAPDDCTITTITVAAESANVVADSGFDYPAGLMNFTLDCGTPGATASITQYYYSVPASGLVARKYNPGNQSYAAIPGAVISQVTLDGKVVAKAMYSITDGSSLDQDGTADGTIVDPAGVASAAVGAPNTGLGGSWDR